MPKAKLISCLPTHIAINISEVFAVSRADISQPLHEFWTRSGLTAVDSVRQGEREEEIASPVAHGYTSKVANPMEISLSRQAIDNEATRGDNTRRNQYTKSHLSLAYVTVALRQIRGETIGSPGQWHCETVANNVAERNQA